MEFGRWRRVCAACVIVVFLGQAGGVFQAAAGAQDLPVPPAALPDLMAALRHPPETTFCGEPVPLDRRPVRERWEKEMLLTLADRPQVILWFKRMDRYFPRIEAMLADAGLPDDLKYIAIIESALRPHAGSSKGAIGYWQFLRSTGRNWGLRIDDRVDERRRLAAATAAAIDYLSALYRQFGAWSLAAAAYNMGEAGLQAAIDRQGDDDYYELYLPLETQRYVLRAVCAKMIITAPGRYGFTVLPQDPWAPLPAAPVRVDCDAETPLAVVAEAAGVSFKTLKDLNPHIRGYFLAPGTYDLDMPPGAVDRFSERFPAALAKWRLDHAEIVYEVQTGDHLTAIADRHGVTLNDIVMWNRIDPRRAIHPGDTLILYAPDRDDAPAEDGDEP